MTKGLPRHGRGLCLACLLAVLTGSAHAQEPRVATFHGFNEDQMAPGAVLSGFGEQPAPTIRDGALNLLHGRVSQRNVVAFERAAQGTYARLQAGLKLRVKPGADGMGLAFLSTAEFSHTGPGPDIPQWEEPNLPGSFAVGLDIYNPPTKNRFDANGNVYDRPQREVSLHWDGLEVANRLSPVEFRDGQFHDLAVEVRFVIGGACVTLSIDTADVYRDAFIPHMRPYESRLCLGARSGDVTTDLAVDDLRVEYSDPATHRTAPTRLRALDGVIIHAGNRSPTAEVELPDTQMQVARIILTLTLQAPPGGFDPWDRSAAVYAWGEDQQRYEILRYITPFGRGYTWKADVTDYQSLLRGKRKLGLHIDTWMGQAEPQMQKGWKVSVDLEYYTGTPAREAFRVCNLWSGRPEYGNPDKPMAQFFAPRHIELDAATTAAKLRLMVTGHGQSPNTKGAGEFMPAGRTVTVNDRRYANRLWKTDCYLNPCRPQGGTWKFDRAGWAPGDVVSPWDIDISDAVRPGESCSVQYVPEDYVNENRGKSRATHWVEGQLILYRDPVG